MWSGKGVGRRDSIVEPGTASVKKSIATSSAAASLQVRRRPENCGGLLYPYLAVSTAGKPVAPIGMRNGRILQRGRDPAVHVKVLRSTLSNSCRRQHRYSNGRLSGQAGAGDGSSDAASTPAASAVRPDVSTRTPPLSESPEAGGCISGGGGGVQQEAAVHRCSGSSPERGRRRRRWRASRPHRRAARAAE